jgi:hypothetical protein
VAQSLLINVMLWILCVKKGEGIRRGVFKPKYGGWVASALETEDNWWGLAETS